MSYINDEPTFRLGNRVRVHYDDSVGTIIKANKSGIGWLYTVRGEKFPHKITPNQLATELTLLED